MRRISAKAIRLDYQEQFGTSKFHQPASIGEDGTVLIKGHYPTRPKRAVFELRYIYEGLGWKMIGVKVNVE